MATPTDYRMREVTTDEIIALLVNDMLHLAHTRGKNPARDERVEEVYQRLNDAPMLPRDPRQITSSYLRGFPGEGKTTAFREAAKFVARALGMEYIEEPQPGHRPNANQVILVVKDLSGEVSNMPVKGMPNRTTLETGDGKTRDYMEYIPDFQVACLPSAGLGILVLDDFSNAMGQIQNTGLRLIEERSAGSFHIGKNSYVGLTGNLGSADGTNVSNTSTAIATRVKSYMVKDTMANWINRTMTQYAETDKNMPFPVLDASLSGFFRRKGDKFFRNPSKAKKGEPYPCPRTWSKLVPELRDIVHIHRWRMQRAIDNNERIPAVDDNALRLAAEGQVGTEAASELVAYYHSKMSMADPIAYELITTGKLGEDAQRIMAGKLKAPDSADAADFIHQFLFAVVEHGAPALVKARLAGDKAKEKELMHRIGQAYFEFDLPIHHLNTASAYLADHMVSIGNNDPKIGGYRKDTGISELNTELYLDFTTAFSQFEVARQTTDRMIKRENGEKRPATVVEDVWVHVVSNAEKFAQAPVIDEALSGVFDKPDNTAQADATPPPEAPVEDPAPAAAATQDPAPQAASSRPPAATRSRAGLRM